MSWLAGNRRRSEGQTMTNELFEAICAYVKNPTGFNRERGMSLIVEGHLSPVEIDRLRWAIREYDQRVGMTA